MSNIAEVKKRVTIPMYFYNIIIPQISDYYSDYPVDFDVRPVACCPIHDEDTPSMRYYEETNTFYCFGCTAGGDVLELHRKFTEKQTGQLPNFDESVAFLYKYFVQGNETAQVTLTAMGQSIEYQSTVIEVMRLSRYVETLEQQLLIDSNVQEDVKNKLWKELDYVRILTRLNKANATDSMNYIKQKVREYIV